MYHNCRCEGLKAWGLRPGDLSRYSSRTSKPQASRRKPQPWIFVTTRGVLTQKHVCTASQPSHAELA